MKATALRQPALPGTSVATTALPTVEDVARVAGVSRQTVSNVLNAPDVVRPQTRERVRSAISELGYRPHASARRLRTRTSSTIGIRLDSMSRNGVSGSVLDRFLHALTEQADRRGMRIMLFSASDSADEIEQYRRLRDGADVDAIVVTDTRYDDERITWLAREKMPFVAFGRPWGVESDEDPTRLWVDVDGHAGTRAATEHLLGRGLSRIGWLGWPAGSGTGDDRRAGWESVMIERQRLDEAGLTALTTVTEEGVAPARGAVEALLAGSRKGSSAAGTPAGADRVAGLDALVCASDSLALGAMMAVREAGHPRFPVIGFDNTPVAQAVGLSSVDQRFEDVATAVLELLMGPDGHRVLPFGGATDRSAHRLIAPQLVVRRSSHLTPVDEAGITGTSITETNTTEAGSTESGDRNRKEHK